MYELIILSLLIRFPLHGYLIAKIANDMLGPYSRISNGTLYPLLTRLEQASYIALVDEGGEQPAQERHLRTFTITETGRKRFHQLMMDTSSNQSEYQRMFHYKVPYLYLLQPRERLHLLNHYINYCQTQALYYRSEAEDFAHEHTPVGQSWTEPTFVENALAVMQHHVDQWQAEADWTMQLREKELTRIEGEQAVRTPPREEGGITPH